MISYGKTVYTYEAENIFCGVGGKEQNNLSFYKAEYTLSDIIEWGGISIYGVDEKHALVEKESPEHIIYEDEEVKIVYKVYGSMLPIVEGELLKEKIELEQHGIVEIQVRDEKKLEYFNLLFLKIKRLIEISSMRKINIEKMDIFSKEIFDLYGEHKFDRPITVYGVSITKYESSTMVTSVGKFAWLTLSELVRNNCFEKYFDKYELLEPIIELYLEPLYSSASDRRTFLNVVQALETYHSRFVTNDIWKYKNRVKKLTKNLPESIAQENRKFLLANSKSFITLESRLADLLLAEDQLSFDTGDIRMIDFPEVISKSRNYYIHYDESIKTNHKVLTEEELGIYNSVLFYILEYYILKELGFSVNDREIKSKLKQRWGSVSQRLEIIKRSREMEQQTS